MSDHDTDSLDEAIRLAEYIAEMLPGILAGDESIARLNKSAARRRAGVALSIEEIRTDLCSVLEGITQRINIYANGGRQGLSTAEAVLNYVERAAKYGMRDYPREFEDNETIMALWDILDNIHTSARAWRLSGSSGEGAPVLASIMRASHAAIHGWPIPFDQTEDDETDDTSPNLS